ncbi:hypothetical protein GCM10028895_33920 [Pontibacter rugosus]
MCGAGGKYTPAAAPAVGKCFSGQFHIFLYMLYTRGGLFRWCNMGCTAYVQQNGKALKYKFLYNANAALDYLQK